LVQGEEVFVGTRDNGDEQARDFGRNKLEDPSAETAPFEFGSQEGQRVVKRRGQVRRRNGRLQHLAAVDRVRRECVSLVDDNTGEMMRSFREEKRTSL
jgi:hypothetical protein